MDVANGKITFTSAPKAPLPESYLYAELRLAIFDVDRENGKIRFLEGVPSIYEDGIDNIVVKFAKTVYEQDIERYSTKEVFSLSRETLKRFISIQAQEKNIDGTVLNTKKHK